MIRLVKIIIVSQWVCFSALAFTNPSAGWSSVGATKGSSSTKALVNRPQALFVADTENVESASERTENVARNTPTESSKIRFLDAIKLVLTGNMRKRDFFKSRFFRIVKKINPNTTCESEEECIMEMDNQDPTEIALALQENFGKNWWFRPITAKFFRKTAGS